MSVLALFGVLVLPFVVALAVNALTAWLTGR